MKLRRLLVKGIERAMAAPTPHNEERSSQPPAHAAISRIGARIRARRQDEGLTLNDLAQRTGVSVSMLSMLERGLASASIGTLMAVTSALRIQMHDLFEEEHEASASPVTRKKDQPEILSSEGVLWRLAHSSPEEGLEVTVNEYAPGTASAGQATLHGGREYGVLVQGSLIIELDGTEYVLKSGDAISYASQVPHRIINRSSTKARAVWVNLTT
ncbi:hypothetical protein Rruber_05562 (plasmid) [Rhodococcus ruber]